MTTLLAAIGSATIVISSIGTASAQDRESDAEPSLQIIRYDPAKTISPSSGTSTVSPSSVPRAMERMDENYRIMAVSLGTTLAGGDFGTGSNTTILTSALGTQVRLGNWSLSASLPWMRIRSRSTIFTGIDATPFLVAPDTSVRKKTSSGFGDLTLGASYTITPTVVPVEVELSGRAKINTASKSSGLSTGKNDYALGADVTLPLGAFAPFASFTYRFLGDTARYRLRDGPAFSAGTSYAFGSHKYLLISYHFARAATSLVDNSHELFAGASTKIARSPLRLTGFATTGLSRGAPAQTVGLSLSFDFAQGR